MYFVVSVEALQPVVSMHYPPFKLGQRTSRTASTFLIFLSSFKLVCRSDSHLRPVHTGIDTIQTPNIPAQVLKRLFPIRSLRNLI